MESMEFGGFIKAARKEKKMTIRQLELYSGVSNAYISQLERGERGVPSPDIIQKLATALGVPYGDLMEKAGYLNKGELIRSSIETGLIKLELPEIAEDSPAYKGYLALKDLNEDNSLAKDLTDEQLAILVKAIYPMLHPEAIDFMLSMQKDQKKANDAIKMMETIGTLSEDDKKEVLNFLEFKKSQAKRQ